MGFLDLIKALKQLTLSYQRKDILSGPDLIRRVLKPEPGMFLKSEGYEVRQRPLLALKKPTAVLQIAGGGDCVARTSGWPLVAGRSPQ